MFKVKYKCKCMKAEVELEVPSRPEGADLIVWMEVVVAPTVALDHSVRSRNCFATTMEYLKMPVDEAAPSVGVKPRLDS